MATFATVDVEEMDHELHLARENFARIFQASPAILCIIQLDGLRDRDITMPTNSAQATAVPMFSARPA